MKTIQYHSSSPPLIFKCDRKFTRYMSVFLAFCMLHLSLGCSYYKVREVPASMDDMAGHIREFNDQRNYAIINQSWHLKMLSINEDTRTLSGIAGSISPQHQSDKSRVIKKTYRFKSEQREPYNELHFMVQSERIPTAGDSVSIPFSDIKAITVNDKNTGRAVLNVVAGTIGTFFAVSLIIIALKSSCPVVYIKDGAGYVFKGELYPGTLTPGMEHPDYLPLPGFYPEKNTFEVLVTNELREKQYTDVLLLWVVDHENQSRVLLNEHGELQTFSRLISPQKIYNESGRVAPDVLQENDDLAYTFNNELATTNSTRELVLHFERPPAADHAKLFLSAKNSLWLDYIYGKFNEQFGAYYNQFQQDQQKLSAEKIHKWVDEQDIPLSVYLKTENGWELVKKVNTVGPMANRDLGIELDLERVSAKKIEVKLVCGFMFWELDYAAIDYDEKQIKSQLIKITPYQAMDENNTDVTTLLTMVDKQYLEQAERGNAVTVSFHAPQQPEGTERSVFLVSQGYYNYIRDYKGIPDFKRIKTFREKNAFTRFSENSYKSILAIDKTADPTLTIQ